jgi:hypothetical protein
MNLQRIKQLAGIKLNESIESVPAIGDTEANMQTAGTMGRDQAYAAYDASQTPATEEIELGNDADTELGWYIIGADDGVIVSGPYLSYPHARRAAESETWDLANRNNHDVSYGFDDNGYFVDADLNGTENNDGEDGWAERLSQEYEDNTGLEDGSEFDPKLDPESRPKLTEQKLSRPHMLDRMKKLAGILNEELDPSEESLIDRYKSGELSREEFMQEMDSIAATDASMHRGEMGMQGDDTPAGNRAYEREKGEWGSYDDDEYGDDYENEDDFVDEGAKVDRFVGHVKKSEQEAGESPEDAESIAWATANKRGMLDESDRPGGSMKMRVGSKDKMRSDGSYLLHGLAGSYLKGQHVGEVQKQLWDFIRSEVNHGEEQAGHAARNYINSLPKEQQQKALDYYNMHYWEYAKYNGQHGKLDESSPHRGIVQQCMSRLQELSDSFVDEEKAFEILEQELIEQGYDDEDISYIKYYVDQEMNPHLHNNSDDSDDAGALASAGYGTDEDYGYYGGEDGMYEEKNISKLPQILKAEEINDLLTLPVDAAKAEAIELINKTNTRQEKKDYLIRQVKSGLSSRAVVKLLYDMLLAGEGHRVQGSSYSRRFSEDFDLNNGYDDINDANGSDYFPSGADSSVVTATGAAGARQGDNPEQKKMQVQELHKELVYGYRKFLNESGTASKKKLTENQQAVSKITPIKFHGTVGVDYKNDTMDYADEITVRATVLDKNNKSVDIQYTINLNAEAEISWEDYDEPTGWNYGSDEPQHETFTGAGIGNGDISDVDFVDGSFSINGNTGLSVEDVAQYINPESLQQLLNPNSYADIMEDKFTEEARKIQPDEFDDHYD